MFTDKRARPARFFAGWAVLLLSRAFFRQLNLISQEVDEFDSLSLEGLRIERGLCQTWQGVGFEINRSLLRNDEIRAGIAPTRQRFVRPERLVHQLRAVVRRKTSGANLLRCLGQIFCLVVELAFRRD